MRVAFECQRGVEQFINGIARLRAQTPEQLSPSIERAGENMLQITIRRGEIGLPQQSIKRREQISLAKRAAEMTPEAHALLARRPVLQIVLRPADQRGYEQVGKVKVILRSEEHTSELQSLMRISYAVFCLKNKIETR